MKTQEHKEAISELLDMFASMHIACIESRDTPNEKMSRYLLEKFGYMDKARQRFGGKYEHAYLSDGEMAELSRYYNKMKRESSSSK